MKLAYFIDIDDEISHRTMITEFDAKTFKDAFDLVKKNLILSEFCELIPISCHSDKINDLDLKDQTDSSFLIFGGWIRYKIIEKKSI